MATTADFRNGMVIRHKGGLYRIVDFQHVKPGKGGAFVRSKLKSLTTGKVIDETWNAGSSVERVKVFKKPIQFLYAGGDDYHFMDNESYDQLTVPKEVLEPYLPFLLEGMTMDLSVDEQGNIIDVDFPLKVTLEVTEAFDAARGDTAGAITKEVTVETGATIRVPPFIKQGEKIVVDTTTGQYLERA
ncbi:MAG: elongation factor P [Candidatus Eisenbacteria bacterium]|nr:elongation factor P [Candidatus Latescibacterota bacterium]MBD3303497.1 elongation factor P [Candidatus Eisenbacteria bacterium]